MNKNIKLKKFTGIKFPISVQISIFLVIIAFVPIAAAMAFKTYELQLLEQIENSNVQQGRLVASFLSGEELNKDDAIRVLKNMNGRFDARIRVLNTNMELLADSATSSYLPKAEEVESRIEKSSADETFVYRLFSRPIRIYRKYFKPPVQTSKDYYAEHLNYDGNEIKAALEGKYGAATRISSGGQVSVNLYSALPVYKNGEVQEGVIGVVLVSRSTYKILQNLYELRLDLGRIFLWSLIVVLVIAVFLTFRISVPLKKLSKQAVTSADKKGRVVNSTFTGNARKDEIGELSRSFSSLVQKLNSRIKFTESFASDVSHEFKNPLAAIRSLTELLSDENLNNDERQNFVGAITEEVTHLESLLTGVRNITKIDGNVEVEKENIEVIQACMNIIHRNERVFNTVNFSFINLRQQKTIYLFINESYFDRILDNLISNAAGFGKNVCVSLEGTEKKLIINVEDDGVGVQPEESQKIFERFYSNRNETEKSYHTGLGLATVKAIVESVNGNVTVEKSKKMGGAKFIVEIPLEQK